MTRKSPTIKLNMLEKLDNFFEGKQQTILWTGMFLSGLFGLLLFEPKVSIGGDDSMYILRAHSFINKGTFPTFQGPLYPIFISLIMLVFGTNLIVFKFASFLCLLGHQYFAFKLFKDYLSPFLLFVFFILISTSAAIMYYGSSTYSEMFYLCIQSIFLYHFSKSFIVDPPDTWDLKRDWKKILISALLLVLLMQARSIGLIGIIAVVVYLLIAKRWKLGVSFVIAFIAISSIFSVLKSSVWGVEEVQFQSQLNSLLLKVPYQEESGREDAYGMLQRLTTNSQVYLGYHFVNIFGLAPDNQIKANITVTLIIYGLFFYGLYRCFRQSKFWLFIAVYVGGSFGATFLILQTFWLQERLIVVFAPLLLAFLLYTLYGIFTEKYQKFSIILIAFLAFAVLANISRTFKRIPGQIEVNEHYLAGDTHYGFPEDWIYYLQMARWVGDNLKESDYAACRKPGMAFIYSGGKEFYGIFRVPSENPEELYNRLKENGVTHVIMAHLRTNPNDPNAKIINTVKRYLSAIHKAYPDRLTLVHKIGTQWPAYLYELK